MCVKLDWLPNSACITKSALQQNMLMRLPADNCEVQWFGEVVPFYFFLKFFYFLVVWRLWSIVAGSLRFQTESRQSDIQPNLTSSPVSNVLFFIYFLPPPWIKMSLKRRRQILSVCLIPLYSWVKLKTADEHNEWCQCCSLLNYSGLSFRLCRNASIATWPT